MDTKTPDFEQLMARLLGDDHAARLQAKQEVQVWSFETAEAMLNLCARQLNADPEPQSRLQKWLARRFPQPQAMTFPLHFDMLTILLAEKMEDWRLASAALLVLARHYACNRHLERATYGGRPTWGSGFVQMPQIEIQIDVSIALIEDEAERHNFYTASSRYKVYEEPLLNALKRLLPQLEPGQITVTHDERLALLEPLRFPYRDVELTLVLLGALAWAGGAECVKPIETIEENSLETENGRLIRAAAQSCREQILSRINTKQQEQNLLRPAVPDTFSHPETLLRPTQSGPDTNPEELLHPAN